MSSPAPKPPDAGPFRLSVLIPAHNEAALIERLLKGILDDPEAAELEIAVIPNGCSDETAARAAAVDPRIKVSSLTQGSKIAALRHGDSMLVTFPRVYLDADVQIATRTLLELGNELSKEGGPMVASPRLVVNTRGASWAARQYFRVWALTDYRKHGHIGSGVYALSESGRARFRDWPDVIADDRFVQQLFLPSERLTLPDHTFTVQSPRTLRAQIRRMSRIIRGNRELPAELEVAARAPSTRHLALLARAARRPSLWAALPVYVTAGVVATVLARRESAKGAPVEWHQDETTRHA